MRWWLIFLLLGGCASTPATLSPRPVQIETATFAMNARISIRHQGRRDSAGLHWTHLVGSDEILLLTPLGQTGARIYRDAGYATLDEGDKHYVDTDVESLMMQVLGWRLQLDGLHHWVLGMPAPSTGAGQLASGALVERDALGRLTVLRQDGWEIHYVQYATDKADSLPARMQLSRGDLQLTLLIDEWEWNPGDHVVQPVTGIMNG